MQIVIDIPEEEYMLIKQKMELNVGGVTSEAEQIIANGILLPKGHGKLKDIDKIISDGRSKGFCEWYDEMKYAPTIIEADKENKKNEHMTADEFAELFTERYKE